MEKYLAAVKDGSYVVGQEKTFHLKFETEGGLQEPAAYRNQLLELLEKVCVLSIVMER